MKLFILTAILGVIFFTTVPTSSSTVTQPDIPTTFLNDRGQTISGTVVFQFNSPWNASNEYNWIETPKAKYFEVDLEKNQKWKQKYNIKSLPTIIIFKNGQEFKRYEGGLMMKITVPLQIIQKDL